MLPSQINDFKTKSFWDDFFVERGERAFEWYSTFDDFYPAIENDVKRGTMTLHLGKPLPAIKKKEKKKREKKVKIASPCV
jgi:hypothetical protein